MDDQKIKLAILAMIEMLHEVGAAPSGAVYSALQAHDANFFTLDMYQSILRTFDNIFEVRHHEVSLTAKGKEAARTIASAKRVAR